MSGIYIPGMEMPKRCGECPLSLYPQSPCWENGGALDWEKRPSWCPLIPVPPHGRLGDLDKLPEQMQRKLFEIEDKAEKELGFDETLRRGMQYGHAVCVDAVNEAPTIIPADKEGEG